jgi:hypothetical protein
LPQRSPNIHYGRKWNYICKCTIKPFDIWQQKKALVNSAKRITRYSIFNYYYYYYHYHHHHHHHYQNIDVLKIKYNCDMLYLTNEVSVLFSRSITSFSVFTGIHFNFGRCLGKWVEHRIKMEKQLAETCSKSELYCRKDIKYCWINSLRTKRNTFYLKWQSVPRCRNCHLGYKTQTLDSVLILKSLGSIPLCLINNYKV